MPKTNTKTKTEPKRNAAPYSRTKSSSSSSSSSSRTPLATRRAASLATRNPPLAAKLAQMRLPIAPIVSVATGLPPPTFPPTMLHLFLLTEPELDAMASFYSQTTPDSFTAAYPSTMDWTRDVLDRNPCLPEECRLSDEERLKVKMRMFARFIGMKGAETSVWEQHRRDELAENKKKWSAEEEIREVLREAVRRAEEEIRREEEREAMRGKLGFRRYGA